MAETRTTRQKERILDVLRTAEGPLTASQIYARAAAEQPTLAKSTVYRNLEAMLARGELEQGRFESGERYYALSAAHRHRHYMICKSCNRMLDLPACPLEALERELSEEAGFEVTDHVLQLYGYCRDCRRER